MFHRSARSLVQLSALLGANIVLVVSASAAGIDFNQQIRPLLSDRCFKCHGPDEASREADLRLDTEDGSRAWIDKGKGLRAITPGARDKSEVWHRITALGADTMPPPESNLKLDPKEIELIGRWIEEGARYGKHWAFRQVEKPKVPTAKSTWARNPIDRFVEARLRREGLTPAPEASRETLIRRLSFDLTGLPPTREEIHAFQMDTSDGSYERLVERLLASPAYGERMANEWLDLSRYADTYGYQSDVERDMSPWRDWVIRAFNANMRYDQFITWQLAGDLLPNATDEQILATAFNRLHRQTNEGGSIEEEYRAEYVADRVHTFGTAFLGLTMECARCHDHKYDPITQENYYELSAFFNNIDESGLYSHFTQATPSPSLLLYGTGEKQKHAMLQKKIAALESELRQQDERTQKGFQQWARTNSAQIIPPTPVAHFGFEGINDGKTLATDPQTEGVLVEGPSLAAGREGRALSFSGENSVMFKNLAHWRRIDPFSFAFWIKPAEHQPRAVVLHHSRSWTDSGSRGYELVLHEGKPRFALIHFWPGNAIAIEAKDPLPTNTWSHITLTYDGSSRASGMTIYLNGKPADSVVVRDHLVKDILHRAEWGDMEVANIHLTLGARFRDAGFKNGAIDEFSVYDECLTAAEVSAVAGLGSTPTSRDLRDYFVHRLHPGSSETRKALQQAREAENAFVNGIREIMVMKELEMRRPTYLLKRGAYDARGDTVSPGTPAEIFPFNRSLPANRLGLAKWTTDRRNPHTSRVVVNRVWKQHFGRGLVGTPEDFGSQGKLPTHPELLDWLAADFMEHGWDLKRLHKLIVSSATYRQSSAHSHANDPDNFHLSRGPKHRFTAEEIRDAALKASGLLVEKVGGPSVKPYQPAGLWEQSGLSKTYIQGTGDELYRRSLYTFWRRTSPPPSMTTFDATSREVCTAKRETTSTPLQALVLMNDPQFIEAARVSAERLLREHSAVSERIAAAFATTLGREPSHREREIAERLLEEQRALFAADIAGANGLLTIGARTPDATLSAPDVAATTMLVSTLMNHDEFVTKR